MNKIKTPTNLQSVVDAVKIKLPTMDFTGKESQFVQLLRYAISRVYRKTYDNLDFTYNEELKEGSFDNYVSQPTIELLSLYVAKELITWQLAILNNRKQYIGTNAFNKITTDKDKYDSLNQSLKQILDEIVIFESEFPDYSEDR